ncbi:MAG TPA: HypC/HybG/HupF family hydrogenase formation chaperone [Methanocella sp.]|uniref:HypC/HybG/HupF family hydrogenase formation chaperone n=1 Tax=Methanocella sp. TaxID=2052833 RepID=UPI002D0E065E|nr:HypC/HybG/HupF family hydrogenase formation chaperone [Methanocella sp.]HTY91654.1 HypC/HybG/HupF family hydrogenase formation chaperone [Methanocella sp.]
MNVEMNIKEEHLTGGYTGFLGVILIMCLAVLAQLKEFKEGNIAVADFGGLTQEIRLDLLEEPKINDWVLVHTGFAIQVVDEKEALEMKKVLDEVAAINEEMDNART